MHAIRQYEFGPPEVLRYEEAAEPQPGAGQVRIAVEAAGVHLLDTSIRKGEPFGGAQVALPMTPGREVAGVVELTGDGVDSALVGRRVVVHLGPGGSGGYAERVIAPASSLHELHDHVGAPEAVAMIGTGRTAFGILGLADLRSDDIVLVPAAAGGLGSLFVQVVRNHGCTVIGLAGGPEKLALAQKLGAHFCADYRTDAWPAEVRRFLGDRGLTVVLDGVGGSAGRNALELLEVGGRQVMFGWSSGAPTQFTSDDVVSRSLTVTWIAGPPHAQARRRPPCPRSRSPRRRRRRPRHPPAILLPPRRSRHRPRRPRKPPNNRQSSPHPLSPWHGPPPAPFALQLSNGEPAAPSTGPQHPLAQFGPSPSTPVGRSRKRQVWSGRSPQPPAEVHARGERGVSPALIDQD